MNDSAVDWLGELAELAPNLVHAFGPKPSELTRIFAKLDERVAHGESVLATEDVWQPETTIWDLVFRSRHLNDKISRGFVAFIEAHATVLKDNLSCDLLPTARKELRNLFLDFSDEGSGYLNKVGELCAIAYTLRSVEAEALGLEVPVKPESRKRIDLLVRTNSGARFPIEILNFHLKDEKLSDEGDLNKLMDDRLEAKVKDKLGPDFGKGGTPFLLLPVLWFREAATLSRFAQTIVGRAQGSVELPACSVVQLAASDGSRHWDFGSVAHLMTKYRLGADAACSGGTSDNSDS